MTDESLLAALQEAEVFTRAVQCVDKEECRDWEELRTIVESALGGADVINACDARVEQRLIDQIVGHWFIQGGEAQFGELGSPHNADELISAILARVRSRELQP